MKKLFPYTPFLALLLSTAGTGCHLWLIANGTDERNLYPAFHISMVLLGILTAAALVLFWLLSRQTDAKRNYGHNFPASPLGAAGHLAAAVGILLTGLQQLTGGQALVGILALLASLGLILGGYGRLQGRKPQILVHLLPCLYFALSLFTSGRVLGSEPELIRYLPGFLANVAAILACYQLWGFDGGVNLGNRNKSLFWSLTAAYLCFVAVPGNDQWPLYLGVGLWFITNLCSLRPMRRSIPSAPVQPIVEAAQEAVLADIDPMLIAEDFPESTEESVDIPDFAEDFQQLLSDLDEL